MTIKLKPYINQMLQELSEFSAFRTKTALIEQGIWNYYEELFGKVDAYKLMELEEKWEAEHGQDI